MEHAIAGDLEQEAVLWFRNIKKMGLRDSDLGTTERAGAIGKGREGVILSILDTWKLRSCFMVLKYRKNGSGGFQPGNN